MWTDNDTRGFAQRLSALAEVMAEPMSPVRIAGYRAALDDMTPAEVFEAIGTAAKSCKFFPKPVELRELVAEARALSSQRARHAEQLARDQQWLADEPKRLAQWAAHTQISPVPQEAIEKCRADLRAIVQRATMPGSTPRGES